MGSGPCLMGTAEFFREGGEWRVIITGPAWVITDWYRTARKPLSFLNYGGRSDSAVLSTMIGVWPDKPREAEATVDGLAAESRPTQDLPDA